MWIFNADATLGATGVGTDHFLFTETHVYKL